MSDLLEHTLVSIELMKRIYYFTSALVVTPRYSTSPVASGGFTVLPDRVTLSGAGGFGSGGISLVGRETLLAGVVGTCVSTVGVVTWSVLTKYDRDSGVRLTT